MRHLFDAPAGAAGAGVFGGHLQLHIQAVAAAASTEAEIVDRDGIFPTAAIAAARQQKLLSLTIPKRHGGAGASVADVAEACFAIARSCASTAMIVAMHHSALACFIDHYSAGDQWHEDLLRRIANEELLVASSTTEGNQGGNVRMSASPLVRAAGNVSLEREATVVSYGLQADCIATIARRDTQAPSGDQALAMFTRQDYALSLLEEWKTLGMRGTCSAGFRIKASAAERQVLAVPYKTIHAQTMVPVSHLLWCSVWTGIAAAALSRAQQCARVAARSAAGGTPPTVGLYARAFAKLESLRSRLVVALAFYERMKSNKAALESVNEQTRFNLLKVEVSEGACEIVLTAMRVCGLAGYREDGEFSVARHYRDILSAPIMINNERIVSNVSSAAILSPGLLSLGVV